MTTRLWSWWDMLQGAAYFALTLAQLELMGNRTIREYLNLDALVSDQYLAAVAKELSEHWDKCEEWGYRGSINVLRAVCGGQRPRLISGQQRPLLIFHRGD